MIPVKERYLNGKALPNSGELKTARPNFLPVQPSPHVIHHVAELLRWLRLNANA